MSEPAAQRILLVAHYASDAISGESAIPIQLFRRLRQRGRDVWLLTHDSAREELTATFPDGADRMRFVRSLPGFRPVFTYGERLPAGLRSMAWAVTQMERQFAMAPLVRNLVRDERIDVVHQPISVSPALPSALVDLGAPLVVGPLNGGMTTPPAFRGRDRFDAKLAQRTRDTVTATGNRVITGKRQAARILIANERSRASLPSGLPASVTVLPETGVDLGQWPAKRYPVQPGPTRFVFLGRLVSLKGVDLLLEAFARLPTAQARLDVVGDGPERSRLERLAGSLDIADRVTFTGWCSRAESAARLRAGDVFVFPSLREAGGMSVVEAMASALPVVVADWGGPTELVDDASAVRIPVDSPDGFTTELSGAMLRLADDPALRRRMGEAARRRVEQHYDWEILLDRLLEVYDDVAE